MTVMYNGVDITEAIRVRHCNSIEVSEGIDSVELYCNNQADTWDGWNPQQGDTLEVRTDGYTSGKMTIKRIAPGKEAVVLMATAAGERKPERCWAWESVELGTVLGDIAAYNGYACSYYGTKSYRYPRMDGYGDGMALARQLCEAEGYALKITSGGIVVYNLADFMRAEPAAVFGEGDLIQPSFSAARAPGTVEVIGTGLDGEVIRAYADSGAGGGMVRHNLRVYDTAQAMRWARGTLLQERKNADAGRFETRLRTGVAAGNVIELDYGMNSGKWFVTRSIHRLVDGTSIFDVRRCENTDDWI